MKTAIFCAPVLVCGVALGDGLGNDIKGEAAWPGEWTVFAQFNCGQRFPAPRRCAPCRTR